jgi:hypothetical protein
MKLKLKKIWFITIIFILIIIIVGYRIRHRPVFRLNSYLEKTYPDVKTQEAINICNQTKREVRQVLKYVLYEKLPSYAELQEFGKLNKLDILLTNYNEIGKKYKLKGGDTLKVKAYVESSMRYAIDMRVHYLRDSASWANRNFIEKYFFFDF